MLVHFQINLYFVLLLRNTCTTDLRLLTAREMHPPWGASVPAKTYTGGIVRTCALSRGAFDAGGRRPYA